MRFAATKLVFVVIACGVAIVNGNLFVYPLNPLAWNWQLSVVITINIRPIALFFIVTALFIFRAVTMKKRAIGLILMVMTTESCQFHAKGFNG